jgi:hypothetical protein
MPGIARRLAVAAAALAGLLPGMAAAGAASSAAYGIYAQFRQDGNAVEFGPLAASAGNAPPAYEERAAAENVRQVVPLVAGGSVTPSLFVDAARFASHVASKGFGVDSISAAADTASRVVNLALMLNPPPPAAVAPLPQPQPFLEVAAQQIQSAANFTLVVPNYPFASGGGRFADLRIRGSLVGNRALTFSGTAGKDTVLFHSANVTITLNRQVLVGVISCKPGCAFTPKAITTDAIAIVLDEANLFGQIVSGEIVLGVAKAD